jgi:hypothetical protein
MAGSWTALTSQPRFCAAAMLLLTDGTVLCQQTNGRQWYRLTPDAAGSYVNGSWSAAAPMMEPRMYFASAVLADGSVLVAGGEYSGGLTEDEIRGIERYDPVMDQWTTLGPPPDWTQVGDAPCAVLADGRVLLGSIADRQVSIFDPVTNTWSAAAAKLDRSSTEESWALMPDGSVLAVDCSDGSNVRSAERYLPDEDRWEATGVLPVQIVATDASQEMGPAVLMPDGRLFVVGATGHTALYTLPAGELGGWAAGPDFPAAADGSLRGGKDAPGCLLPSGNVLCSVASVATRKDDYPGPSVFFEFDGQGFTTVTAPSNAGGAPYQGCLLLLPTGQVLFTAQSPEIYVYTPEGMPEPEWKPTITNCLRRLSPGQTFTLSGTQLNGLSQAVGYGDDYAAATNYPIVRIETPGGAVRYCRTADHSTMAVVTAAEVVTTQVTVPADIGTGPAQIVVVANGIASDPFSITIDGPAAMSAPADGREPAPARAPGPPLVVIAGRTLGQWAGLGAGYVLCGVNFACNWTFWAERQSFVTLRQQCTETRDEGYTKCTQTADKGYSQCSQTADEGYSKCCTWWPCSWACAAWVWVSNIVCVAWTWVSNIVCVATTWISNVVCVGWAWVETRTWFWKLVRRLTCAR